MSPSTEQIAIWILKALKDEWEINASLLKCRTETVVLRAIKSKHKIEDVDISKGIRFLIERQMLDASNRSDGRATLPNRTGLDFLAAHLRAEKAKGWTLDLRLKIFAIILTIIGFLYALLK